MSVNGRIGLYYAALFFEGVDFGLFSVNHFESSPKLKVKTKISAANGPCQNNNSYVVIPLKMMFSDGNMYMYVGVTIQLAGLLDGPCLLGCGVIRFHRL